MLTWLKANLDRKFKRNVRRALQTLCDSAAYRLVRDPLDEKGARHIVFVCKGNICRSAFAEYYLKGVARSESLKIESCGIDVDQGVLSPEEAVLAGREFGVDLAAHCSKGFEVCDLKSAELIVPMEYGQYRRLVDLYPGYKNKIHLLRDFAPWPDRLFCNIYDPFGLGEAEFRRCFGGMRVALEGMRTLVVGNACEK